MIDQAKLKAIKGLVNKESPMSVSEYTIQLNSLFSRKSVTTDFVELSERNISRGIIYDLKEKEIYKYITLVNVVLKHLYLRLTGPDCNNSSDRVIRCMLSTLCLFIENYPDQIATLNKNGVAKLLLGVINSEELEHVFHSNLDGLLTVNVLALLK